MLLMPNKKKIVSIVVAGMKDKKEGPDEGSSDFVQRLGEESSFDPEMEVSDETESESSYAMESAARSLLSALKKDDAKGMAKALKDFVSICDTQEDLAEGEM